MQKRKTYIIRFEQYVFVARASAEILLMKYMTATWLRQYESSSPTAGAPTVRRFFCYVYRALRKRYADAEIPPPAPTKWGKPFRKPYGA